MTKTNNSKYLGGAVVIGIDHGNARTKTAFAESFVSGLTKHDSIPPLASEVVEFNGSFYTIDSQPMPYKEEKYRSEDAYVMTLFALAREINARGLDREGTMVVIGAGLPISHYGRQRKNFRNYLMNRSVVEFSYGDSEKLEYYCIQLRDVKIFPQGYPALVSSSNLQEGYSKTYLVDIGGITVDVMELNHGKPQPQMSVSIKRGVNTIIGEAIDRIAKESGKDYSASQIEDFLRNRPVIMSAKDKHIVLDCVETGVREIFDTLKEKNVDLMTTPCCMCGGGALLLKNAIDAMQIAADATYICNIAANAIGYELLV